MYGMAAGAFHPQDTFMLGMFAHHDNSRLINICSYHGDGVNTGSRSRMLAYIHSHIHRHKSRK